MSPEGWRGSTNLLEVGRNCSDFLYSDDVVDGDEIVDRVAGRTNLEEVQFTNESWRQAFTQEANVSDPMEQHEPTDDLDVEAETIKDLDVSEEQTGQLRSSQSYGASSPAPTHKPG